MPESLLQTILRLLDLVESPVVHRSALDGYAATAPRMLAEGVLIETVNATEIPRPNRYGPGAELIVRRTSRGLFGAIDGDDFSQPVPLEEGDVRQYAVSVRGLVEKLRRENGITGEGFRVDDGLVGVGEKSMDRFGVVDVYLSLPNERPDVVLGRLKRLVNPVGRRVVFLTPRSIPHETELRRILAEGGIVPASLLAVAGADELALDWHSTLGLQQPPASDNETLTKRRLARSVGTQEAVDAVHDYIAAKALTLTKFGNQFDTTDRTVRRFLQTSEMRRSNFEEMAKCMGVSADQLLRGELPPSIPRRKRR